MTTGGGINTVMRDGKYVHIVDLDSQELCTEWTKLKREVNELYVINKRANTGWRGVILSLLRIRLPDRNVFTLDGSNEHNQSIYPEYIEKKHRGSWGRTSDGMSELRIPEDE